MRAVDIPPEYDGQPQEAEAVGWARGGPPRRHREHHGGRRPLDSAKPDTTTVRTGIGLISQGALPLRASNDTSPFVPALMVTGDEARGLASVTTL